MLISTAKIYFFFMSTLGYFFSREFFAVPKLEL